VNGRHWRPVPVAKRQGELSPDETNVPPAADREISGFRNMPEFQ
jgi:hypothetical protein